MLTASLVHKRAHAKSFELLQGQGRKQADFGEGTHTAQDHSPHFAKLKLQAQRLFSVLYHVVLPFISSFSLATVVRNDGPLTAWCMNDT